MKTIRVTFELTDYQIDQLRTVMDGLPLDPYAGLICAVVKKLPLESDAIPSLTGADADPRPLPAQGPVGGFSLHAEVHLGKCKSGLRHKGPWRVVECGGLAGEDRDIIECAECGEQRNVSCDFDEEYS